MAEKDVMTVLDRSGRQVKIPRRERIEKVLPANLRRAWDDPEALYGMLVGAIQDNLGANPAVSEAVARLKEIDPNPERAAVTAGIFLIQTGKAVEAETLFKDFIARNGDSAVILTNLAKIHFDRSE